MLLREFAISASKFRCEMRESVQRLCGNDNTPVHECVYILQ